jgi:AraC-like DNA-binding protein/quercetin dioxygenase-like cupin family protein
MELPPHQARIADAGSGVGGVADTDSGRLILTTTTDSATLRFIFFEAGACIPRHRHSGATVIYAAGGPCVEHRDDGSLLVKRLSYIPPGQEHSLEFQGSTNLFLIEISDWMIKSRTWPDRNFFLPATLYGDLWRIFLCVTEHDEEGMNDAFVEFFDAFLGFTQIRLPERLERVVRHMHSEWRNIHSIGYISKRFSVSPQHLSYTFKKFFGVTIQQYGVLLRLDYARNLLWGTDIPIARVAAETNFADQSHLTRAFRANFENTPLRFRRCGPSKTYESIRLLPQQSRLAFVNDLIDLVPKTL